MFQRSSLYCPVSELSPVWIAKRERLPGHRAAADLVDLPHHRVGDVAAEDLLGPVGA